METEKQKLRKAIAGINHPVKMKIFASDITDATQWLKRNKVSCKAIRKIYGPGGGDVFEFVGMPKVLFRMLFTKGWFDKLNTPEDCDTTFRVTKNEIHVKGFMI